MNLANRVEKLEKAINKLVEQRTSFKPSVKEEERVEEEEESILKAVRRSHARDAYSYGLQIMDVLFTKEELCKLLLFDSKKSIKPGLDKKKVEEMLGEIDRKFGDKWDIKIFTAKANQKCRDSSKSHTGTHS